ncbi:hypothetical protein GCM10027072_06940 [Streptomyces bullii]
MRLPTGPTPAAGRTALPGRIDALLATGDIAGHGTQAVCEEETAGVVTGHAHTAAATSFAGRPLVVGPGVTQTPRPPWEGERVADRGRAGRTRLPCAGGRGPAHQPLPGDHVTTPGTTVSCW